MTTTVTPPQARGESESDPLDLCVHCAEFAEPDTGLCTDCAAKISAAASFITRGDPDDPNITLVEIRRRRTTAEPPNYKVTGDMTPLAVAHFCLYFLTETGLMPPEWAQTIVDEIGPPPPSEFAVAVVDDADPELAPPAAVVRGPVDATIAAHVQVAPLTIGDAPDPNAASADVGELVTSAVGDTVFVAPSDDVHWDARHSGDEPAEAGKFLVGSGSAGDVPRKSGRRRRNPEAT